MTMNRRSFVAALPTVAAATVAAPAGAQPAPSAMTSYDDVIRLAHKAALHKQSFSSTRPNGYVWYYIRNSLNGYQFGWKHGAGSLHPTAVFNGMGVVQGLNDTAWQRYRLSDVLERNAAALPQPSPAANPWLHAPAGLTPNGDPNGPYNMNLAIETLQRRGADIIVCNTALQTVALAVERAGVAPNADAIHADLGGLLVPGAFLVPSGVSALDALHEAGFSLFDSNL